MKEVYQKIFKKLTFHSNPVLFNGQNCQKQKGSGTSDQSLFRSLNKFKNVSLFVTYYLTKFGDVMQSTYCVIPKINLQIYASQLMASKIVPLPFVLLNLETVEGKGFEYLENQKSFLDETKNIFCSF